MYDRKTAKKDKCTVIGQGKEKRSFSPRTRCNKVINFRGEFAKKGVGSQKATATFPLRKR